MEKSHKVGAQIYGYTVCLVAVITFLIPITTLVNAIIDLGDPLHAGYAPPGTPSLASFENYKMDMLKTTQTGDVSTQTSYIPDDETLHAMFEAAKNDKIQSTRHRSKQNINWRSVDYHLCYFIYNALAMDEKISKSKA